VRDLLRAAFGHVGLDWHAYTQFERDTFEPSLCGNSSRLKGLGWQPRLDFNTWVGHMVDHDIQVQA
jgi:GDP-D-mannose dehydratase